ncbi:hypothetical protein H7K20_05265 [Priestia aryabhattai]|nr:hypothetical protein [Priestia aryabhattai]
MTEGQCEESCGKRARDEEAHRPPVETEVLHGNQLGVASGSAHVSHLFVFRLDSVRHVSTSFFYGRRNGKNSIIQKYVMLNK